MNRRVRCRTISYKRQLWPWFTVTAAESRHEWDIKQSSSNKERHELDRVPSNQLRITEGISLWQGMNSILQMFNVRSDCFWVLKCNWTSPHPCLSLSFASTLPIKSKFVHSNHCYFIPRREVFRKDNFGQLRLLIGNLPVNVGRLWAAKKR